ncbi:hypothetical protein Ctob_007094, partial [Chrysochromulina tobinii]
MACRNGIVIERGAILDGLTGANNNPQSMGGGAGSVAASLYQIKYMGKETTDLCVAGPLFLEALRAVRMRDSKADDKGTDTRFAMNFAHHRRAGAEAPEPTRAVAADEVPAAEDAGEHEAAPDANLEDVWNRLADMDVEGEAAEGARMPGKPKGKHGLCNVYKRHENELPIPVDDGTHYALRPPELAHISALEFKLCY